VAGVSYRYYAKSFRRPSFLRLFDCNDARAASAASEKPAEKDASTSECCGSPRSLLTSRGSRMRRAARSRADRIDGGSATEPLAAQSNLLDF